MVDAGAELTPPHHQVGNRVFALHLLPSGIIRENVLSVIGNGLVIDCEELRSDWICCAEPAARRTCSGYRTAPTSFCHTTDCWTVPRSGQGAREWGPPPGHRPMLRRQGG